MELDHELQMALLMEADGDSLGENLKVGYEQGMWEIIIRYHGDLTAILTGLGAAAPELLTDQYAIAYVTPVQLAQLNAYTEVEYIEKPKALLTEDTLALRASCIATVHNAPVGGLRGDGVLIAILDSGIDYQNPYFINENGESRIVSLWDQTDSSGTPPEGFQIGSEYTREELSQGLSPEVDAIGHGTAVSALALEAAPGAELIVVKLASSSGYAFTKTTQVMRALKYVIEKARMLNRPVAVNISLGTNNGSHSGDSLFETYIDEWARRWKNSIVIAAGNEGTAGRHAAGVLEPFQRKTVEFQISGRKNAISLQIWRSFMDPIQVGVVSPDQTFTGIQPISPGVYNRRIQGNMVTIYYGEPNPYTTSVPILIDVSSDSGITEGIWKLELEGLEVTQGNYNIWINAVTTLRRDVFFLVPEESVTITIPSVVSRGIAVAAYDPDRGNIADFSGRGYTRGDTMIKPDLAAPGVGIGLPESTGILRTFNGTSMAAPFVTGSCAVMMEWGILRGRDPDMHGERLKAFLLRGANRNIRGVLFPDRDWGYGKLCLESAINEADRFRSRYLMARQTDCGNVILDEEYLDIVYQGGAPADILPFLPILDENCAIELIRNYFLAFVPIQPSVNLDMFYHSVGLSNIPILYGISVDQKAVDLIGSSQLAQPSIDLTGQGVLIAIIDTGIQYQHPAFIDEAGNTKIMAIWDQTLQEGPAPLGFTYGTEYTREQIQQALRSENPLEVVPSMDENGHGTYIAGVAAGYTDNQVNFSGAAPGAELIVVKLKQAKNNLKRFYRLQEEDLAFSHSDVILATAYALNMAEAAGRPIVLLYALSNSLGPHDGTFGVEKYLQRITYYEGIGVFAAAGNEANKGHHTEGSFSGTQERETQVVEWNVAEGETGLCLMVWSQAPDEISVSITTPRGYSTGLLPYRQGQVYHQRTPLDQSDIMVAYKNNSDGNGDSCILIQLERPGGGIWKMELTGELIINGEYHIWMTLSNWTKADTRFLRPDPAFTVTMPGTGEGSITMGGFDIAANSVYAPSGRGPNRMHRIKPDLISPATGVFGPLGMDSYQTVSGTSAAAALAAGAGAQLLEWGMVKGNQPTMNTNQMRRILIRGADRRSGISYPNNEWGYGLLNIYQSLEY